MKIAKMTKRLKKEADLGLLQQQNGALCEAVNHYHKKPLTIITTSFILDVAAVPDPPLTITYFLQKTSS